jgi:hypothetical protein
MIDRNNYDAANDPDMDSLPTDGRAHLRTGMLVTAGLRIGDADDVQQVRIRNLSEQGLMAEVGFPLAMGTPLVIDLPGVGEVNGTVAWSTDGRIGVALGRAIDIALVNAARSAS